MNNKAVIVVGVIVVGLVVVYFVSTSGSTTAASGLRNDTGNWWGFAGHLLTDLEKAAPSWFSGKSKDTLTDAELNSYASSSGFADHS
jgi:hypothetical protein